MGQTVAGRMCTVQDIAVPGSARQGGAVPNRAGQGQGDKKGRSVTDRAV